MVSKAVRIPVYRATLEGQLDLPGGARGLVLFVDGRAGARHCARNRLIAGRFREGGVGTLLFDLLTHEEEDAADAEWQDPRVNAGLLAGRLVQATRWVSSHGAVDRLPVAYFGAGIGAASAIIAAALVPEDIAAMVLRAWRPDLGREALARVSTPTLLLVGSDDGLALRLNEDAQTIMRRAATRLVIVRDASEVLEDAESIDQVVTLASDFIGAQLERQEAKNGSQTVVTAKTRF